MSTFNQAQYDDLASKSQDVYAHTKYDILLDYLKHERGLSILNAGCGSADLSVRLARGGHRVGGIDPEPSYIELARRTARGLPEGACSFCVTSIEDYNGPGGFDCVVSTDVLEHIADDRTAFARLVDLVRPGGLVL